MVGETNLQKLLKSMAPELDKEDYVFISIDNAQYGDRADLDPVAMVMEENAMTLVIPKSAADEKGIKYEVVFKRITLTVHSGLDAVGLTAAFSDKLADHGLSANVIAGYFHDHIFVPADCAERAMTALRELGC